MLGCSFYEKLSREVGQNDSLLNLIIQIELVLALKMSRRNCRDVDRVGGLRLKVKLQQALGCLRQCINGFSPKTTKGSNSREDEKLFQGEELPRNTKQFSQIVKTSQFVSVLIFHITCFVLFTLLELVLNFVTNIILYRIGNVSTLYLWNLYRRFFLWIQFSFFYRTHIYDPYNIIGNCDSANSKDVYVLASAHFHGDLDRSAIQYAFGKKTCNTVSVVLGRFTREVEDCMPLIKNKNKKQNKQPRTQDNIAKSKTFKKNEQQKQNQQKNGHGFASTDSPISRNDNPYLDMMVTALCEERNPLWIAPEGRINETPRLLPLHTGVARLALKCCMKGKDVCSGANIVPVFIIFESTSSFRSEVYIELGEPMYISLNEEEINRWDQNVKCKAGSERVGQVMKDVNQRLLSMSCICPDKINRVEITGGETTGEVRNEYLKVSASPYRMPITKKIRENELHIFSSTDCWWVVRMLDICFMFEYSELNNGLKGFSWPKRISRLREAATILTNRLKMNDMSWIQQLQNVFLHFQSFDNAYLRLTGGEAFTAPTGIWWGCGQHMKMHLRWNTPKSCRTYIEEGKHNIPLVSAFRRSIAVLRNFTVNVQHWEKKMETFSDHVTLYTSARSSFRELSIVSIDFITCMLTG